MRKKNYMKVTCSVRRAHIENKRFPFLEEATDHTIDIVWINEKEYIVTTYLNKKMIENSSTYSSATENEIKIFKTLIKLKKL